MDSAKKKVIYALAFVHLGLIAVTIFHGLDNQVRWGFWAKPLSLLCSVNFSVWQYGFFSPDVGKSTEVQIDLLDVDGHHKQLSTHNGFCFFLSNQESSNRLYSFKTHSANDTALLDLCARSVCTRLMNMYPDVYRIGYSMRSVRYPTMKSYRNGEPVSEVEFYTTEFQLRQPIE